MSQTKTSLRAALKQVPLFNALDDKALDFLVKRVARRHFKPGETIFVEGSPCDGLYVIEAGIVKIFVSSASGREQTLLIEGPGKTMGDLSVLDGGKYPASAIASTGTDLLLIRSDDLQTLCLQHLEVGTKLLKAVASYVRPMISIVEQLCFSTVRQRLAALLIHLAEGAGKLTAYGTELRLTSSKKEIASQLGTVPELISRNLAALQSSGLVKVRGKSVIISNMKALKAEATIVH